MSNFIPKIIDQYAGGSNGKPLIEPNIVDFPRIIDIPRVVEMNSVQKFINKNFIQKGGYQITLPNGGTIDVVTTNEINNWESRLEQDAKTNDKNNNQQNDFIKINKKEIDELKTRIVKIEAQLPVPSIIDLKERVQKLETEAHHDNKQDAQQQQQINKIKKTSRLSSLFEGFTR